MRQPSPSWGRVILLLMLWVGGASVAASADTVTFPVKGEQRRAIIVNAPADGARRPAVIVLHGGMGSAEQMRLTSGFDAVAKANGFMTVYAEGTDFGGGRHAWNTGYLLRRQVRDADDIAYFDALIDRLIAQHGADASRIFMTGGSNGGMMTFVYGVARPERLAAVAPVVASMFSFDNQPKVPLPILIINGAKDDEVPLAGGMSENRLVRVAQAAPFKPVREVVDFWVKANRSRPDGATVVDGTVTTVTHAAGKGGSVTEFVLDAAGGHGWPGTRARRDGNEPISAFKGAERVWKFFADKSRASGDAGEQSDSPSGASSDRNASKPSSAGGTAATATPLQVQVLEFPELSNAARRVPIKVHVPASGGPFPVVVISHGAGGDWDTHFAQAQDLAAHGYAVLCLEHIGSNRARLTKGLRPMKNLDAMIRDAGEVLARPKDVRFALDQAQRWNASHEMLKGKFDLGRVGVMGHSFGAFTTMVVCGMRPALDWLVPPVPPGKGLGPDLRDSRVKCGVALSPQGVGEPFFITESFGSLQVPLLGISGTKDDQQAGQPASNRKDAFALWPRGKSQFVWLANAKHLDFTDSTGTDRRELPSATRGDVQPVTRAVTRAFLDLHLKGEGGAAEILTVEGLKPYLRGPIDTVEILSK